jgi:hypothetical protein
MSVRSISPDLVAALKRLRLGGLLPTLAERFSLAEKEDTPYEDLLLMLLVDEISRRDSTASIRRADVAGLDPDMVLERWCSDTGRTPVRLTTCRAADNLLDHSGIDELIDRNAPGQRAADGADLQDILRENPFAVEVAQVEHGVSF